MKKKFTRSLLLNKKSVAKLGNDQKSRIIGGNTNNTCEDTCDPGCIPDTVEPSCDGTCWYSDCNCGGDDGYTGDRWGGGWGDCS